MHQLNVALAAIGLIVLCLGLFSEGIRRRATSEPLLAVLYGIAVGPAMLGLLDVSRWGDPHLIMEEGARLTLAVGLMAVALRLRLQHLAKFWKPTLWLLLIGMPVMFAIPAAIAAWMLPVSLLTALLIAGAITPTDPVVASSIVTGKFANRLLPPRIRTLISLESGANDGLAYLFMLAPVLLLTATDTAEATSRWVVEVLLLAVVAGTVFGASLGWAAAKANKWAEDRQLMGDYSFAVFTVALSLFALGAARLLLMDELVVVFACGLAFNVASGRSEEHEEAHVQESVNRLFTLPAFVLLGLVLPWEEWARLGWGLLAGFALACLLLRRLPLVPLLNAFLSRPYAFTFRDWAFIGWFGPNGLAAIFYALYAVRHTGHDIIWPFASFVICASILIHGVTAAPFTRLYARGQKPQHV